MSDHKNSQQNQATIPGHCPVEATLQTPLTNENTSLTTIPGLTPTIKVPVVIAEKTIQIVLESNITLCPSATEIKRVKKHVFLEEVKLVPVRFTRIGSTDFFQITRAKLFVAGHIRKNIEYSSRHCKGQLEDRIADVAFSGFTELAGDVTTGGDFIFFPIMGISENAEANFLNNQDNLNARLDKAFFQNLVKYNEQPFGELVAGNFYELDFSPTMVSPEGKFSILREKIVLDLTVKVLQVQQLRVAATIVVPSLPGLTPPVSPPLTNGNGLS